MLHLCTRFVANNHGLPVCDFIYLLPTQLSDRLWSNSYDAHARVFMGQTAETVGKRFSITRQQCDEYALSSQQRWKQGKHAELACVRKRERAL